MSFEVFKPKFLFMFVCAPMYACIHTCREQLLAITWCNVIRIIVVQHALYFTNGTTEKMSFCQISIILHHLQVTVVSAEKVKLQPLVKFVTNSPNTDQLFIPVVFSAEGTLTGE